MERDSAAARKARGAFFTPPSLSQFMAKWCLRDAEERVFEPSCGEAAFLTAAVDQLRAMGVQGRLKNQLTGVEIHGDSAVAANERLAEHGADAAIRVGNFFDIPANPEYDAVIGNPPYIRYQALSGSERSKANQAALAQGVRFDGLTNSWAPFLVHAAGFLRPGGRLALVLPAELLSVNYAAPARQFLMNRFSKVALVVFHERVFPGVLEEVVIVLAEGEGPTDHCELYQAKDASDLDDLQPGRWTPTSNRGKWMAALLPSKTAKLYRQLVSNDRFGTLNDWGETDLGMVTGNNRYFTMSIESARKWNVPERELMRISPPSSRHLRGLMFGERSWDQMRRDRAAVYLFRPTEDPLSNGASRYIEYGESLGVQEAYKCRVRTPWWRVPLVRIPDLFLTYMNHAAPRLISNRAHLGHLNSIHGVTLSVGLKRLGTDLLPMAALNSLTLLGAELVGRSYGGGVLKLEPREADCLPIPTDVCIQSCAAQLRALRPQLARALRHNDLDEVVKHVDRIILRQGLRLRQTQIETLRQGRRIMFQRRLARSGKER
ncbi:MAG: N-6 DNA methylase [Chloroflexota bacterium]|nr:N-6 DNA methylase [Caldilineaceae bacterium]MDE0455169.1 N-6 DNA methylase [Gammaproteobacteria bacterium]MDE2839861.1 N-6 DNA methylase [Chloroflexota bacterium]